MSICIMYEVKGDCMKYLRGCCILFVLFVLFYNTGCIDSKEKQTGPVRYGQAIEVAKKYVLESNLYKSKEIRYMYEPDSTTWIAYSSSNPKACEEFGLMDKQYYAIYFFEHHLMLRDGDFVVFVDKNKGRIIGVFYYGEFIKNLNQ